MDRTDHLSTGPRHAGPRPRHTWWRGPWPPSILLLILAVALAWELSWAVPLLAGQQ